MVVMWSCGWIDYVLVGMGVGLGMIIDNGQERTGAKKRYRNPKQIIKFKYSLAIRR